MNYHDTLIEVADDCPVAEAQVPRWGIHNNAEGKIALIAVESPEYKRLMNDPRTTKIRAFRSSRA
jgi:hypothetical protein